MKNAPHADSDCYSAASGYIATSIIANGGDARWPLILKYLLASWSLSIATQVVATCLIAFRIWSYSATIPAHVVATTGKERPNYLAIVWIIVESGLIYTVSTIILLVFFELNSQASNIIGKALGQISVRVWPSALYSAYKAYNLTTVDCSYSHHCPCKPNHRHIASARQAGVLRQIPELTCCFLVS